MTLSAGHDVARSGAAPTRLKAANDNHGGRRSTIMIRMDGLPIMRGEVAVIDRLLQELPVAVNDNDVDPPERFIS